MSTKYSTFPPEMFKQKSEKCLFQTFFTTLFPIKGLQEQQTVMKMYKAKFRYGCNPGQVI